MNQTNKKKLVCILNYGSGNVGSVYNIIKYLNYKCVVSNDSLDLKKSSHIILPGVGSFGSAMKNVKKLIPINLLEQLVISKKKPFLGICVGMQILADKGYEHSENEGLGWIKGTVNKLKTKNLPLPHVGWNEIEIKKKSPLYKNFSKNKDFYFVHSYAFNVFDSNFISAETYYGNNFCSSVESGNIFGIQFHPEKSQKTGMLLLNNFLDI